MSTKSKIVLNMMGIVLLFAALVGVTWALLFYAVYVDDNFFGAGYVKIDLNNGKKVFDSGDLILNPGDSVTKPLSLTNNSSDAVHYRLYLENVSGALQDALVFNIYDGDTLLKSVTPAAFTGDNVLLSDIPLAIGDVKIFTIKAVMDESAGNLYGAASVTFDFVVQAVQSKNNPDKEF